MRFYSICLAFSFGAAMLRAESAAERRLGESAEVLRELLGAGDRAVPQELLDKAQCMVVVPALKKGAFVFGGKYGRGFAVCRNANNQGWGAPAGVRVEGGSFGFQIGGAEVDVVMAVMSRKGMQRLTSSKFTLGGDASVAAGPLGRTSSAETDATMRAEILTWSRSRGVFAGIALNGATLRQDGTANQELYGSSLNNKSILQGKVKTPAAARDMISALNKYSSRRSS